MARIAKLPPLAVSQIAAGEVIESPVSVVKELVENSLDAGSRFISVFLNDGGFTSIQVRDDGSGIHPEDMELALTGFATSKISNAQDIFNITSLGFRGEALASIASVAEITVESFDSITKRASMIRCRSGKIMPVEVSAHPSGTRIVVQDLFAGIPARRKFQPTVVNIYKEMIALMTGYALADYEKGFELFLDGSLRLHVSPHTTLLERINALWPDQDASTLVPVYKIDGTPPVQEVRGYISAFDSFRTSKMFQYFFVNGRQVSPQLVRDLSRSVYAELLPAGRYPVLVLFLTVPPETLDVNAHPQKKEVRFREPDGVRQFLYKAMREVISSGRPMSITSILPRFVAEESGNILTGLKEIRQLNLGNADEAGSTESGFPKFAIDQIHTRLFGTFIVASDDTGLYLIDLHTAHERVRYEHYLRELSGHAGASQPLLSGIPMKIAPAQQELLKSHSRVFENMGFTWSDLGPAGQALEGVPSIVPEGQELDAFLLVLNLIDKDREPDILMVADQLAKDMSCQSAYRKNSEVSRTSVSHLLEQLSQCRHPETCPHGRPTYLRLDRFDLFRLFKRSEAGG